MNFWPFKNKAKRLQKEPAVVQEEPAIVQEASAQVKNQQSAVYPLTDVEKWQEFFGQGQRFAGQPVNEDTAMRVSAVFSCVRLVSSAISCAPLKTYTRAPGDLRARDEQHPLAMMLRLRPNRFMTAATFWKAFMQDKLLAGNGYAVIERAGSGSPLALYPVRARNARVYYAWELGWDVKFGVERNRLFYEFLFNDGNVRFYDQTDVLHVPNVGWSGKYGITTVRAMGQALGVAMSAEQSAAVFFENGMQSQFAISLKRDTSPEALERFKDMLREKYSGVGNHHRPLVMPNEGKAEVLSMSAEDAQLLDSRKFSVVDICRWFGVHPVMIGENEKTSSFGGGIEQMGRWFNSLTLNEHMTAIEQELESKLFSDNKFAEFDESELTRGDSQARANYFRAALGSTQQPGWMTINEVRAAEGYGPKPGCDTVSNPQTDQSTPASAQGV